MKTRNNTVLITGGSAGIGFEIARLLVANDNQVIITGRDPQRLERAVAELGNARGIVSDVSDEQQTDELVETLLRDFPEVNLLINNAGKAFVNELSKEDGSYGKAAEEMQTNYLSIIRLNEKLLSHLKGQPEAAIVNVSSIVAFAPNHKLATYSASKAALHSYTQSLRISLESSSVKVFEVMPPLVNTTFSEEIGGERGIHPKVVAEELLAGLDADVFEIHVAGTAQFYELFHASPTDALRAMNSK